MSTDAGSPAERLRALVPEWIRSLTEVLTRDDPALAELWQVPDAIARAHMAVKHPMAPPDPSCKACGAAQGLIFLDDVTSRGFDDLRRAAKATARLRDTLRAALEDYRPAGLPNVSQNSHEFLRYIDYELSRVMDTLSDEPAYAGPFTKADPYALIDTVSLRLFPFFTDAEISVMIPDGGDPATDIGRVANRRHKWKRATDSRDPDKP